MSKGKGMSMLEKLAAAEEDEKRLGKNSQEIRKDPVALEDKTIEPKTTLSKKAIITPDEKIKVVIDLKKPEKTFSVTRVSENDHALLKSVVFTYDTTFHDVVGKMIDSIPESIVGKSYVVNNLFPKNGMTNMKIYSADHKIIKKLAHKHGVPQHQVLSAYISIAEFDKK